MPRNISAKPGPKSRQQKSNQADNIQLLMGEGPTENESGSETFQSPELEDQTDYGLDFTSTRPTTSRFSKYPSTHHPRQPQVRQTPGYTNPPNNVDNSEASRKRDRKQRTPRQREAQFWKTVKELQARTSYLVPKTCFSRLIREIMIQESTNVDRITYTALTALQEATEIYLTTLFQDAYCCTLHRGRVTLNVRDIELARFLRGPSDPGNR